MVPLIGPGGLRCQADPGSWRSDLLAGLGLTPDFAAADDALQVTSARVPASDQMGIDLPLLMTIRNDTAEADALLRVRCPFANFSEKHTVDRGEGAPAMREVKSIPVPANKTIELKRDGYHVMLLQTRQKLVDGADVHMRHRFPESRNQRNGGAGFTNALTATAAF